MSALEWLDGVRADLDAATPGPWHEPHGEFGCVLIGNYGWEAPGPLEYGVDTENGKADAELVAHAPDRLDRMERALRAVLERHRPEPFEDEPTVRFCVECQRSQMNGIYPCPTVTTIREALA